MNSFIQKIMITVTCLIVPLLSNAQSHVTNCGKIHANLFMPSIKKAPLAILTHNGEPLKMPNIDSQSFVIHKGEKFPVAMTLALAPGYHEFSAVAIEPSATINNRSSLAWREAIIYRPISSPYFIINFGLHVTKNKIYRIAATKSNSEYKPLRNYDTVVISSTKEIDCQTNSIRTPIPQKTLINFKQELPKRLQIRLDALTKEIKKYYEKKGEISDAIHLMLPTRKEQSLGIIIDLNGRVEQGLVVQAVSPLTFAEMVGFKENDIIISFNGHNLTTHENMDIAITSLQKLIYGADVGSSLTFGIIRNNMKKSLKRDYEDINLPAVKMVLK